MTGESPQPEQQEHLGRVAGVERRVLEELVRLMPQRFPHAHPPVRNVNVLHEERLTFGHRVADRFADTVGSWRFIIIQSLILVAWIILNVVAWVHHWDPYPFILLNLTLSFQAAYAAPIIMMSQNRQEAKDRLRAEADYEVNQKAEDEIKLILQHLEYQDELMLQILHRIDTEVAKTASA